MKSKATNVVYVCLFLIVGIIVSACVRDNKWEDFKKYHGCSKAQPEHVPSFKTRDYTFAKGENPAPWLCNNGVLYYR